MQMGTNNEDTDPSSPRALRPPAPPLAAASHETATQTTSKQPTTDPGLGPPSSGASGGSEARGPVSPPRRTAVTVPPPSSRLRPGPSAITPPDLTPISAPTSSSSSVFSPAPSTKDSVELLLEGMAGPRPDRRKTKPQSDGEASAAYHAEHGVRRARAPSQPDAKVVVERTPSTAAPALADTVPGSPDSPGFPLGSREALSTFVPARVLRRRVALAIVAGALLVLISFVGFRLGGHRPPPVPAAASIATTAAAPASPAPPPPVTAAPEAETSPGEAARESTGESAARPAAAAPSGSAPSRRHARPSPDDPAGDLGEFKSKF